MASTEKRIVCELSNKTVPENQSVKISSIRDSLLEMIKKEKPTINLNGSISLNELNRLRTELIKNILQEDRGALNALDNQVIKSIIQNDVISKSIDTENDVERTFGQRLADKIAEFGGSWKFIILFGATIFIWVTLNTIILLNKGFDPYPFILLNLILSCIAAIQAPIIMMSQNRMEEKDRKRSENDYIINLKAELEIRNLHEKIDHLIMNQMQHLNQIQEIQIDLLQEISQMKKGK
jgi:uncharacterized membrane protein